MPDTPLMITDSTRTQRSDRGAGAGGGGVPGAMTGRVPRVETVGCRGGGPGRGFYRAARAMVVTAVLVAGLVAGGCRHRTPDVNEDWKHRPQGEAGRVTGAPHGAGPRMPISRPRPKPEPPPVPKPEPPSVVDVSGGGTDWQDTSEPMGGAAAAVARGEDRRWEGVVYFAYDQHFIGEAERPKLEALADYLKRNAVFHVVVEGHCDERGSDEYNRGLGERRALSVKEYLGQLGVAADRVKTISYGEERPADKAGNEAAYARNRRAEFVIVQP